MTNINLWPEQPTIHQDQIETGFTLEDQSGKRQRFWYRCSSEQQASLSASCDPYVLAALFTAMRQKADLRVHGQVSPSLVKNLSEFQSTWANWRPWNYTAVEIKPDELREIEPAPERAALASFSGGVDSAFTVWRDRKGLANGQPQNIQAGLMVHGFDIRLNQPEVFDRAAHKAKHMLDSLHLKLITMATNIKKTGIPYEHSQATLLASCFMLLQGGYTTGIIASTFPNNHLFLPWGSNPMTDPLLSSASFSILHDGASYTRLDKIKDIAEWPEVVQYLRVCLRGKERDENCCRCEKCILTILEFRALGLGLPACFKHDVTLSQLPLLRIPRSTNEYRLVLAAAKTNHISAPWVTAAGLQDDPRLGRVIDHLSREVDTGWRCKYNGAEPCAWGAARALWAFAGLPETLKTPAVQRAIQSAVEFLFKMYDFMQSDYPCEPRGKVSALWSRLNFPLFYQADRLLVLRALAELDLLAIPEAQTALNWLESLRKENGQWRGGSPFRTRTWRVIGDVQETRRWITLQAARVLQAAGR